MSPQATHEDYQAALELVPTDWRRIPLRHLFDRVKILGFVDETMLSVYRDQGVIAKDEARNPNKTAEDRSIYQLVDQGWLVVNRMKAWQGSVGISSLRGIVSGHYICFRPIHGEDSRFLNWLLRSGPFIGHFGSISRGVRPGQIEIDNDQLESTLLPLPPLEQQRRIADFLDDQVTRIDAAIASRTSQMDHLTDSLRSSSHDAVTGSAVQERRSSSLRWADTLPRSWGEPRICHVASMGTGHTPSRSVADYWVDCNIPWLTTGDVHRFRHDEIDRIDDAVLHISELGVANSAAVVHPAGTVALSRTASAGFSIIMDVPMATSQDYATWTPGNLLSSEYLLWCLRVMRPDIMGRLAIGSTHKTIYFPDLMSIRIPLPTLVEQHAAVEQLREAATWVSSGRDVLAESIDRLRELKTSVITAAVTGALNVATVGRVGGV